MKTRLLAGLRSLHGLRAAERWAASIPFTWVIVGVAVVIGVLQLVFHASINRLLDSALSMSFDSVFVQHQLLGPLTSVLFPARALHILVLVPVILVLLGTAERLMGTGRTVLVYIVVAVLGSGLGLAVQGIGIWLEVFAAEQVRSHTTIDPLIPVVGSIMAASAFTGPLLRRRIRILGFAILAMFVLYSGMPVDLYRSTAAVVGLVVGLALHRHKVRRSTGQQPKPRGQRSRLHLGRSSNRERRSLIAALVAITAVGPLITIVAPGGFGPMQPLGTLFIDTLRSTTALHDSCVANGVSDACSDVVSIRRLDGVGPVLVTLLPLVVLLVSSIGILRGRRVALWLAFAVNLFLAVLGVAYYGVLPSIGANTFFRFADAQLAEHNADVLISIAVPLAIAVLLVVSRRIFPSDVGPGLSTRFAIGATGRFFVVIASTLVIVSGSYLGAAWMLRAQFSPAISFSDLLTDLPERFMPVGFLVLERVDVFPQGDAARFIYEWVGPTFWFIVIVAALVSVSHVRLGAAANEGARIRSLLHVGAPGSLSWMTTWSGHHYWFSGSSESVVAYRVINGVAIATGEPLGPPDDRIAAISDFAAFSANHGWTPVFYAVSGDTRPVFDAMQWSMMQIAEEAVIALDAFSLEGKKMQDVRTSINRAVKLGIRAEWTSYTSLTMAQLAQVREISELWMADKDLPEMGFTLGGVDELVDSEVRLMLAVDADERVLGVTSWLPTYRRGEVVGWTLDFMRRRTDTMNGVMEFTLAEAILRAKEAGLQFVSLSAAPLARSGGSPGAETRLLDILGRALEPVYGFQSLLAFKQKFRPERVPLYLAYADPLTLPAVGVGLARAYVPTMSARQAFGFLTRSG